MINITELILCKTVTTESFPDRGWIGIVVPSKEGKVLAGIYTRAELYREVKKIMEQHGEPEVRLATSKFKVPDGYSLMFAPSRDAYDGTHARKLIEKHLYG